MDCFSLKSPYHKYTHRLIGFQRLLLSFKNRIAIGTLKWCIRQVKVKSAAIIKGATGEFNYTRYVTDMNIAALATVVSIIGTYMERNLLTALASTSNGRFIQIHPDAKRVIGDQQQ